MTLNIPQLIDLLQLRLHEFRAAATTESPESILESTRLALLRHSDVALDRPHLAILHVLARAAADQPGPLDPAIASQAGRWMHEHGKERVLLEAELAQANARQLEELYQHVVDKHPEWAAVAITGASWLPGERGDQLIKRIASDDRKEVREHLLALWSRHKRLPAPGSITIPKIQPEAIRSILSRGIDDSTPSVRRLAIAAAYGTGFVEILRDQIVSKLDD